MFKKLFTEWIQELGWEYPISSVKTVIKHHLFNQIYVWSYENQVCAYSVCYFGQNISHIAYVFITPFSTTLTYPSD